jgi:hypothetical protein
MAERVRGDSFETRRCAPLTPHRALIARVLSHKGRAGNLLRHAGVVHRLAALPREGISKSKRTAGHRAAASVSCWAASRRPALAAIFKPLSTSYPCHAVSNDREAEAPGIPPVRRVVVTPPEAVRYPPAARSRGARHNPRSFAGTSGAAVPRPKIQTVCSSRLRWTRDRCSVIAGWSAGIRDEHFSCSSWPGSSRPSDGDSERWIACPIGCPEQVRA